MTSVPFTYRPPLKMMFIWLIGGVFAVGLATLPWILVLLRSVPLNSGMLLLAGWSLPLTCLGIHLFFCALSYTTLTAEQGRLRREKRLLGLTFRRDYEFKRACFVDYRIHEKRRGRIPRLWIFLKCESRRVALATQFDCCEIVQLADWLERSTGRRCSDLRHRVLRPGLSYDGVARLRAE